MKQALKFMTFALFLTEKGITDEDFNNKSSEEKVALLKEHAKGQEDYLETIKAQGEASAEEINKLQAEIDTINKRSLSELTEAVSKQGVAITKVLDQLKGNVSLGASMEQKIHSWIEENADKIRQIKSAGHGLIEFATKVVGDMTTGSATNPDGIPELFGVQNAPATPVNLRGAIVDPLVTTIATSSSVYAYTETTPKDGDFAFVAEGTLKPQMDFKIETRYAEPVKIAAYEVMTEESVTDIPNLQAIATDLLRKKHDIKRENGILFGDGIAPNPKGATSYGRLFVAGAMATSVQTPNFMDVVNACITDIYTTHNYQDETPYMANLVMINPVDFFINLVSAKDLNGLPLYPMASIMNRVTIGGVTIIPFEDIPTGKIFVCDMSKYNVTNYVGYSVRIGWINDQFITNKFTMVGESRFHAFVKKLDEQAFIYDDIATIKGAIAI